MKKWLHGKGIIRQNSSAYSPESNEKARCLIRTLLHIARILMQDMNQVLGRQRLRAEAISTASYIRNRLFSAVYNDPKKTLFEAITEKRPNVRLLRCFGSKAFVHIPKAIIKGKLETRAEVGYLIGFENGNCYKVYLPQKKAAISSRDVKFMELYQQKVTPSRESGSESLDPQSVYFSLLKVCAITDPSPERDISSCSLDLRSTDENDRADWHPFTYYRNVVQCAWQAETKVHWSNATTATPKIKTAEGTALRLRRVFDAPFPFKRFAARSSSDLDGRAKRRAQPGIGMCGRVL